MAGTDYGQPRVTSWNKRVGPVVPLSGDYLAWYATNQLGYLLCTFLGNSTAQETLSILYSGDGESFANKGFNPVYVPGTGYVRDPSIIYYGGVFYVACTTATDGDTFDVLRSTDLKDWTKVTSVTISGATSVWAPDLVIGSDGTTVYCFVAVDATTLSWVKATASDLSTWSSATALTVSSAPSEMIDPDVHIIGNTCYLFYKNNATGYIELATASGTDPTADYTVSETGNWASWGQAEGPSLVVEADGSYTMYMDQYVAGTGIAYSKSTSLTSGWSSPVSATVVPAWLSGTNELRHGTVLRLTDSTALAKVAAFATASLNQYTNPTYNNQSAPAGAYVGMDSTSAAVELSDGTHNIRIDNDGTGIFRVLTAGVSVRFQVDSGGNMSGLTSVSMSGELKAGYASLDPASNHYAGTTAGTIDLYMPFQGTNYKKALLYIDGYENSSGTAQTASFQTAFTNTPIVAANNTGLTVTASTTGVTFPTGMAATATGWIVVEGN